MRIVLLGAPGSGKGTQGALLSVKYSFPKVATGEMLRAGIAAGHALAGEARAHMAAGALVPDDLIQRLVEDRLAQPDAGAGFILDGFPRSIPQAEGLDRMLGASGHRLDVVIKIAVGRMELLKRLTSRRICPGCAAVYNLLAQLPAEEGVCDRCGTKLVQREDDTEATARRRLQVFASATTPLIDWYDGRRLLVIVHGEGPVESVFRRIVGAIGERAESGQERGQGTLPT